MEPAEDDWIGKDAFPEALRPYLTGTNHHSFYGKYWLDGDYGITLDFCPDIIAESDEEALAVLAIARMLGLNPRALVKGDPFRTTEIGPDDKIIWERPG